MSIDWRASLVPAAAVIPAPIAYTKVVAVKKLVVGLWLHHRFAWIQEPNRKYNKKMIVQWLELQKATDLEEIT